MCMSAGTWTSSLIRMLSHSDAMFFSFLELDMVSECLNLTVFFLCHRNAMKIKHKKSAFYLLRTNSWATYVMILLLSAVNWDGMIANYNITHWNKAYSDVDFLLNLSDKALPILDQHRAAFEGHYINKSYWDEGIPATQILDQRIQEFVNKSTDYSWPSWTWPESKALKYFEEKGFETSIK